MTLTFPRDMISGTCWEDRAFSLVAPQEVSRTIGGRIQARDLGPEIWRGVFSSYPMPGPDANALMADFQSLRGTLRSFYAVPPRRAPLQGTAGTPKTVTLSSIAANRDAIGLSGLQAGEKISAGDYVSIWTGTNTELLRFVRAGTANASGVLPSTEVVPAVRAGVVADVDAVIEDPLVEMVLVPGTLDMPRVNRARWRVVFQAVQVLR